MKSRQCHDPHLGISYPISDHHSHRHWARARVPVYTLRFKPKIERLSIAAHSCITDFQFVSSGMVRHYAN